MSNSKGISRKQFLRIGLLGSLAGVAGWWGWKKWKPRKSEEIPVNIVGANHQRGHKIRDGKFPEPVRTETAEVVIVGAGIAGMAAAWKLRKAGITDIRVLELEDQPGGNSQFGQGNGSGAYPWGAHYLPVPNPSNRDLIEWLEEIGVVTGWENSLPKYETYYLCGDPRERLKIHGKWYYGILPKDVTATEKAELEAFHALCEELEGRNGNDGLPIFNLPVNTSSRDPEFLAWNTISMAQFLDEKGWKSPALRWYVEYCCRDDYGTDLANTSAWAGLHYFASRTGYGANAPEDAILTWPEGNGFLAKALAKPLGENLRTGSMVWQVAQNVEAVSVSYLDTKTGESVRINAKKAILALPGFIRKRILPPSYELTGPEAHYSPWAVVNVHVNQRPQTNATHLCWDNVAYQSPSLGYVVSDHQKTIGFPPPITTLTWYYPLSHLPPAQARTEALNRTPDEWRAIVLADLERMHNGITDSITGMDVWLWGHGMIAPIPGYLFHPDRTLESEPQGNIHFAHSDLSGISIFEEAFFQGLRAAREIIAAKT